MQYVLLKIQRNYAVAVEKESIASILNEPIPQAEATWDKEEVEIVEKEAILPAPIEKEDVGVIGISTSSVPYSHLEEYIYEV